MIPLKPILETLPNENNATQPIVKPLLLHISIFKVLYDIVLKVVKTKKY